MKNAIIYLSGLLLLMLAGPSSAVSIYECVDEEGNSVFRDRCPPGTKPVQEKKYRTGTGGDSTRLQSATGEEKPEVEITMYSTPDCDACVVLGSIIDQYQASYTEKNINSGDEVKRELQKKVGGASTLTIPTIIVGETVVAGYKKNELISALEQAGFSKPAPPEPEEEEPDLAETAFVEEEETTSEPTEPVAEGTLEVVEDEQGRQSLRPVEQ